MTCSSHTCFSWEQVKRTKSALSVDHSFTYAMPRIEDLIASHSSAFADDYEVYVDYGQGRPVKMNTDEATFTDVERFLLNQFDSLTMLPDQRSRGENKGSTALSSSSFTLATHDNRPWVQNVVSSLRRSIKGVDYTVLWYPRAHLSNEISQICLRVFIMRIVFYFKNWYQGRIASAFQTYASASKFIIFVWGRVNTNARFN